MESTLITPECTTTHLRPIARWVREPDGEGRDRLVMVWSVPDVDAALIHLAAVEA
jgi:hypothetical protein